jgi:hypothetical protein
MKYTFTLNEIGTPQFNVGDEYEQLRELGSCEPDYVVEIVSGLEKVLNGETEKYDFGFEVYNLDCDKNNCSVLNTFDDWKEELNIPTSEIYQLMKDWRDFLSSNNENSNS